MYLEKRSEIFPFFTQMTRSKKAATTPSRTMMITAVFHPAVDILKLYGGRKWGNSYALYNTVQYVHSLHCLFVYTEQLQYMYIPQCGQLVYCSALIWHRIIIFR